MLIILRFCTSSVLHIGPSIIQLIARFRQNIRKRITFILFHEFYVDQKQNWSFLCPGQVKKLVPHTLQFVQSKKSMRAYFVTALSLRSQFVIRFTMTVFGDFFYL